MKSIYSGHRYELDNLKAEGVQVLQFRQDAPTHPDVNGTSCQEVIRVLIDRVQVLHDEKPWQRNAEIIGSLRRALMLFEVRAIERKADKGAALETWPVAEDGHFAVGRAQARQGGLSGVPGTPLPRHPFAPLGASPGGCLAAEESGEVAGVGEDGK